MRRVIAVFLALTMFIATTAESCEDKKRNARKPGGALSPTTVVTMTASATQPGFHWKYVIQGPNFRTHSGTEKTSDVTQRVEVVNGKDIHIEWSAWSSKGAVYHCKMTVAGGLRKAERVGNPAACTQNISAIFDPNEYQ